VIKGDGIEFVIAAASICAKVTRDRMMRKIHEQHPLYNFEQHKGYGTAAHVAAIYKHGPCPYHRMTFAPLKNMGVRPSLKLAAVGKSNAVQSTPPSNSKRARSAAVAIGNSRKLAAVTASLIGESDRTLRLRRRTQRRSSDGMTEI